MSESLMYEVGKLNTKVKSLNAELQRLKAENEWLRYGLTVALNHWHGGDVSVHRELFDELYGLLPPINIRCINRCRGGIR